MESDAGQPADERSDEPTHFRLSSFELDLVAKKLLRRGRDTRLDARPVALLAYLIAQRSRVISREELEREVWGGLAVSEAALSSALRDARRALGDSGSEQNFVRTLRGEGLRFVANVEVVRAEPSFVPIAGFDSRSPLVVLPFFSLSDDPSDDLFSQGITEDLCVALSGNAHLAVVSNRSIAELGRDVPLDVLRRDLGVRYVVEGTARRADNRVRVTAKLIDAETGHQVFATSCDRDEERMLEIQQAVATELLQSLGVEVREVELDRIRRKAAYDPAAFEHFREGWRHFNAFRRKSELLSRKSFQAAIDLEPKLAEAHALLGGSLSKEFGMGWRDDPALIARAQHLVERALELDPTVAEGHVVQAGIDMGRNDFPAAEQAATLALRFNPNHDVAYLFLASALRAQGDFEGGRRASEICSSLNPRSLSPYRSLDAVFAYSAGRADEAVLTWESLRSDNSDLVLPRLLLALHYQRVSRPDDAHAAVVEALAVNPDLEVGYASRLLHTKDAALIDALRGSGLPG